MKTIVFFFTLSLPSLMFSQPSAEQLFNENFDADYLNICNALEDYFKLKHPGLNAQELSSGEHRDGEFVKYKRWQSFWKSRLTPEGKLGDLSEFNRKKTSDTSKDFNLLEDAEWANLSYSTDLGVQIGLGRTTSLAFHPTDPNIFYVGAAIGGVWKTINGGSSYEPLGDELPYLAVSSLVLDQSNPEIIYAAISDNVWYGPPSIGVYKSIDGGGSWSNTSLEFQFSDNTRIYWMTAKPDNQNIIFVGTSDGLYKTSDGFETVELIAEGVVSDIKFKPGSPEEVYFVGNTSSFFKSSDGGITFEQSTNQVPGSGRRRLIVSELNPELIYVSANNMLFKSTDSGVNFDGGTNISSAEVGNGIVLISPSDQEKLIVGNFNVWASEDGGDSFDMISDWLPGDLPLIHVDQRNAFINPLLNDRVYLCNDGGVYSVNVNTNEFTNLSNGLQITQYYDIAISQSDVSVVSGGSQDNGNVYSQNGQWFPSANTGDGMTQAIDPTDENLRYWSYQNGSINRTFNGDVQNISNNIPSDETDNAEWQTPFILDPNDPAIILAGYQEIFRSPNNGDSWEQISDNLPFVSAFDLLAIAPSNSERIYAVENYGVTTGDMFGFGQSSSRLFVKSITDNEWEQQIISVTETVEDIIVNPNDHNHVFVSVGGYEDGHKVFQSFDAGENWENISGDLPNVPASAIVFYEAEDNVLFVGTDAGVFYSYTHDISWNEVGEIPHTFVTDLEIQLEEKLLRVGTHGRGIFETSIDANFTSVETVESKKENCITLFPNPVKESFTISCFPQNGQVIIYSMEGEKLGVYYTETIDCKPLSAGTYIANVYDGKGNLEEGIRFVRESK